MSRSLTLPTRQAIYASQTKEAFIVLMTISHPNWTDDVRISSDPTSLLPVANVRGTLSNGLEYLFGNFAITLPSQDSTQTTRATISVDNVSREIVRQLRQANTKVNIDLKVVLSSNPDLVEVTVSDFKLERVQYDAFVVTGDISIEYFDLEPFPFQRFTPSKFPAIF